MNTQQKIIAVIDDDPEIRKALKRLLRGAGYEVQTFASIEEFLGAAPGFTADCFVLDMDLGSRSGLELAAHPLVTAMKVPFVVITGSSDERRRAEAEALGCVAYLRKPFAALELLEALAAAVSRPSGPVRPD